MGGLRRGRGGRGPLGLLGGLLARAALLLLADAAVPLALRLLGAAPRLGVGVGLGRRRLREAEPLADREELLRHGLLVLRRRPGPQAVRPVALDGQGAPRVPRRVDRRDDRRRRAAEARPRAELRASRAPRPRNAATTTARSPQDRKRRPGIGGRGRPARALALLGLHVQERGVPRDVRDLRRAAARGAGHVRRRA